LQPTTVQREHLNADTADVDRAPHEGVWAGPTRFFMFPFSVSSFCFQFTFFYFYFFFSLVYDLKNVQILKKKPDTKNVQILKMFKF
jgi:hypothetical protein